MLGRTFLRRLQASHPYVCLPCLRSLRNGPSARSPRPLDAFCAARRFHAAALVYKNTAASPPGDEPIKPEVSASKSKKRKLLKRRAERVKKEGKKTATPEKTSEEEESDVSPPTIRRIRQKDDVPAKAPEVDGNTVGPGTTEKSSPDDQSPTQSSSSAKKERRATRIAEREAKRAARRAAAQKQEAAKKADGKNVENTSDIDIGDILERAVEKEKGAAEVMAEAAKRPKETKKAETIKQALLRAKKPPKPRRVYPNSVSAKDVQLTPIEVEQPPIPRLAYGLDRVLFNPGVYHLQDTRTQVYNFDPYLQKIMPVADFNFDLLKKYITSSQDETLSGLARSLDKRYVGSTSSMTAALAHFHFLLSRWREVNTTMLSREFPEKLSTFTRINRLPAAIFLRWKNGTYAIDADKQYDTANILSMLGRSMEKLLTMPSEEFERYRRGHPDQVSDEEREVPESYHYTTQGDMLMRSQLDARDSRLPGTGMFDLKTRAVVSIRMDVQDWQENTGYQIKTGTGDFESFEREYYDMMRSTMLKYSLQVRMGRMDGIFVAFHNIERIFGFQYVSLDEMDMALHSPKSRTRHLGDQEFRISVDLLNKALNTATERFPETSIRFHFEAREGNEPFMYIFAEAMPEEEVRKIQDANKARTEAWERKVLGLESDQASSDETAVGENEDGTLPVANRPADPEHQPVDAVMLPELFEIPDEEPQWSSVAPHAQPEALEKNILETPDESHDDITATKSAGESSASDGSKASEAACGPLLALKLWTKNKVNGESVDRVDDVTEETEWTVDYLFEELSPADAKKRYDECKRRRAVGLDDPELRKEGLEEEEKVLSYYQRRLRDISRSGREWRDRKDEEEKGKEKVVLDLEQRERPIATELLARDVVSMDGYMSWLYGKRN
ncbi:mitochondrial membrane protein pet127 [Diplodia corticola]|uniref:Mitochondrial membrane protein pet127 n=1 Tax=Diplodia corticola TaxID=236234 RepID=A0A1J9RFW1_9PEZI|nr:mitochondrial membrane protein pet127 [Diplodia corticola]OJD38970.1 mitochondrial membrane protein pet127 [Diplodia corticola]